MRSQYYKLLYQMDGAFDMGEIKDISFSLSIDFDNLGGERKLDKIRRAGREDLVIAVSSNLNVDQTDLKEVPGHLFFFKNRIDPRDVIERLDRIGGGG